MPRNLTRLTLGELLSAADPIIRRNAVSILKRLQIQKREEEGKTLKVK